MSMWKNLLLIPISLMVFFIIFEAFARIWFSPPNPYSMRPGLLVLDKRGFWVIEPEFHGKYDNRVDFKAKDLTVTKYGTRLVPCLSKEDPTGNRIFLIGDSQTFGVGLSDKETWANLLQCRLNASSETSWMVYNMGIPGINIDQYYTRTEKMLSKAIRPGDHVIVSVTWNDLHTKQSNEFVHRLINEIQQSDTPNTQSPGSDVLDLQLIKPLRRYQEATWRYWLHQKTGIFIPSFNSPGEFVSSAPYVSVLLGIILPKARLLYYRFRDTGTLAKKIGPETFSNNFQLLSAISTLVKRRGGRLIVNLLPNRLFFDDYYYKSYSQDKKGFPAQDYMMYVAQPHCAQLELECITSFPALATSKRDDHTFPFDGHYNEVGAARIAEFLHGFLKTRPTR